MIGLNFSELKLARGNLSLWAGTRTKAQVFMKKKFLEFLPTYFPEGMYFSYPQTFSSKIPTSSEQRHQAQIRQSVRRSRRGRGYNFSNS